MASVKLILRKDKVNKNTGLAPLYLRIIKSRKAKFVSLGLKKGMRIVDLQQKKWTNF